MADAASIPRKPSKTSSIIRLFPAFPSPLPPNRSKKRVRLSLKPRRSVAAQTKPAAPRSYTPLLAVVKSICKELDEVEEGVNRLNLRLKRRVTGDERKAVERKASTPAPHDNSLDALYRRSFQGRLVAADLYRRSVEGFSVSWQRAGPK